MINQSKYGQDYNRNVKMYSSTKFDISPVTVRRGDDANSTVEVWADSFFNDFQIGGKKWKLIHNFAFLCSGVGVSILLISGLNVDHAWLGYTW